MAVDPTLDDVIVEIASGLEGEMMEVAKKIRLASSDEDGVQLLADSVADGSTELWSGAMHVIEILEEAKGG